MAGHQPSNHPNPPSDRDGMNRVEKHTFVGPGPYQRAILRPSFALLTSFVLVRRGHECPATPCVPGFSRPSVVLVLRFINLCIYTSTHWHRRARESETTRKFPNKPAFFFSGNLLLKEMARYLLEVILT